MPDTLDPEAAVTDDPAATAVLETEAPAAVGAAAPSGAAGDDDLQAITYFKEAHAAIKRELAKVIVGQHEVIDQLLIAIVTRSHALLVGVPGLAKTLLISTLAQTLNMNFKRIQFTPDLMPSDITGTEVIFQNPETNAREFKFLQGPLFANVILADEINRTPPKTQAAMLEAMQERRVTVGGTTHVLPDPFFVLATQNPVEQEGTYTMPEAQLDRFMFLIYVDYPKPEEELQIMRMATGVGGEKPDKIIEADHILYLQRGGASDCRWPTMSSSTRRASSNARARKGPKAPDLLQEVADVGCGTARELEPDFGGEGARGDQRAELRELRRCGGDHAAGAAGIGWCRISPRRAKG